MKIQPLLLLLLELLVLVAPLKAPAELIAIKMSDGQHREVRDPVYLLVGSTIEVRVRPASGEADLPENQYLWSGPGLAKTKGAKIEITFTNVCQSATNYQVVSVKGRSEGSLRFIIFDYEVKLTPEDDFPGRSKTQFGVGEIIHFSLVTRPPVPPVKATLWSFPDGLSKWVEDGEGAMVKYGDGSGTFFGAHTAWPLNTKWGKAAFSTPELEADFQLLDVHLRKRNLAELVKLADSMITKWLPRDHPAAVMMMNSLCTALSSYDFGTLAQYQHSQRFARQALATPEKLTVAMEANLLFHLIWNIEGDLGGLAGDAWAEERQSRATQWMRCWRRYHTELKALDKELATPLEPFPIGEILRQQGNTPFFLSGGPPDPKLVRDPVERAKYEASLKRESSRHEMRNSRSYMQQNLEFFVKLVTRYLSTSYASPPARDSELEKLLQDLSDPKERAAVMSELVLLKSKVPKLDAK